MILDKRMSGQASTRTETSLRIAEIAKIAARFGTPISIGIDGPGASGKSTLASGLAESLPNTVLVEGDDFYRPESDASRSESEIAGMYDLPRLVSQVLIPHSEGREFYYQRYDWESETLRDWKRGDCGTSLIVEGVYSTHQSLRDFYDMRIWVISPREVRLTRGLERDGEEARDRWINSWMPAEDRYIEDQAPQDHAHLVLDGSGAAPVRIDDIRFVAAGGLLLPNP